MTNSRDGFPWLLRDQDGLLHIDDLYGIYSSTQPWSVCEEYGRGRRPTYKNLKKIEDADLGVTCLSCLALRRSQ